jgi:hypothetical protein
MSDYKIKLNPGWEQAIRREAQKGINQIANDWNRKLEHFHRQYGGKPVSTVHPALARLFRQEGINASGSELNQYAQQISEGVRITFKAGKV